MKSPESPLAVTPAGADPDAWFDVKVIYRQEHHNIDIGAVPAVFKPQVGPFNSPATKRSTAPTRQPTFSTCAVWTAAAQS